MAEKQAGPLFLSSGEALRLVKENEWQRTLVGMFRAHGWREFHDRVAYRSDPGWPDLTLFHPRQKRVIWVEVKKEDGNVTPAQETWLRFIVECGQEAYVLRPSDWDLAVRIAQERVA